MLLKPREARQNNIVLLSTLEARLYVEHFESLWQSRTELNAFLHEEHAKTPGRDLQDASVICYVAETERPTRRISVMDSRYFPRSSARLGCVAITSSQTC